MAADTGYYVLIAAEPPHVVFAGVASGHLATGEVVWLWVDDRPVARLGPASGPARLWVRINGGDHPFAAMAVTGDLGRFPGKVSLETVTGTVLWARDLDVAVVAPDGPHIAVADPEADGFIVCWQAPVTPFAQAFDAGDRLGPLRPYGTATSPHGTTASPSAITMCSEVLDRQPRSGVDPKADPDTLFALPRPVLRFFIETHDGSETLPADFYWLHVSHPRLALRSGPGAGKYAPSAFPRSGPGPVAPPHSAALRVGRVVDATRGSTGRTPAGEWTQAERRSRFSLEYVAWLGIHDDLEQGRQQDEIDTVSFGMGDMVGFVLLDNDFRMSDQHGTVAHSGTLQVRLYRIGAGSLDPITDLTGEASELQKAIEQYFARQGRSVSPVPAPSHDDFIVAREAEGWFVPARRIVDAITLAALASDGPPSALRRAWWEEGTLRTGFLFLKPFIAHRLGTARPGLAAVADAATAFLQMWYGVDLEPTPDRDTLSHRVMLAEEIIIAASSSGKLEAVGNTDVSRFSLFDRAGVLSADRATYERIACLRPAQAAFRDLLKELSQTPAADWQESDLTPARFVELWMEGTDVVKKSGEGALKTRAETALSETLARALDGSEVLSAPFPPARYTTFARAVIHAPIIMGLVKDEVLPLQAFADIHSNRKKDRVLQEALEKYKDDKDVNFDTALVLSDLPYKLIAVLYRAIELKKKREKQSS